MARGPEFVEFQVQKRKEEVTERQKDRLQDHRVRDRWDHDLLMGITPAEHLPYLPVPGLGNRMALDPNWTSAPPRTEPWPPETTPARITSPPPLTFPPRNRAINDYPDAVAAYAPDSISRDPPDTSQQNRGAHGTSHTQSTKSKTRISKSHSSRSKAASDAPHSARYPPNPLTSPGNLDSNRIITSALARTPSAAPRAPMSVPNAYNSPANRGNFHSTTRALARTASAAPAVPQSPRGLSGSGSSSRRNVHHTTRPLSRMPSAAPARINPPSSPIGYVSPHGNEALQAFGMTPLVNSPAPISAPVRPLQYVNPQNLFASPAAPVAASVPAPSPAVAPTSGQAAAPPNNNSDAQGGDSEIRITRTTFGGA
ncbi:hypothetical protein F5X99DRAFT_428006 [Biscogniauxia marginata]|nr:hypothetical protein F5X99DRAFT_428006 [Biscogniauxia marginata]